MMLRRKTLIGVLAASAISASLAPQSFAQGVSIDIGKRPAAPEEVPEYHQVQPGDTLFDISGMYYRDPYQWPKVWSFNPQITNPHWIYPGDIVFLEAPSVPGEEPAEEAASLTKLNAASGRVFPLTGFYTGKELETFGKIKYARVDRRMLHPLDEVYLELDDVENVQIGDQFALNEVIDRVYNDDDEVVAVKYRVTGMVKVTKKYEETKLVSGEITQLWDVIERGSVLFAAQPQLVQIDPRTNEVDIEARILDSMEPIKHYGQHHYVFVNKGHEEGVKVGNRFYIWDRTDIGQQIIEWQTGNDLYEEEVVPQLPWQLVGEATVIFTSANYSTLVITDASREIVKNQRVTMQKGH